MNMKMNNRDKDKLDNKTKKSILRKSNNNKEKNRQKNKKEKITKKDARLLKLSSESEDDSEHYKSHKKNKNNKKENTSKSSNNEVSKQSDEDSEEINNEKKNKKGNKTFNFSNERNEEDNNNNDIIKRKLTKHKSGRGNFIISSKKVSPSNTSYNSYRSNDSNKNDENKSSKDIQMSKDNPINLNNSNKNRSGEKDALTIKKKFVKSIEYDKFSYKQYKVKNYHSKPLNILKEEIKSYVLSKQIDFSVIVKPKKERNKKGVMFNVPIDINDINKRRMNHNKYGARKSVIGTINNSSFLNFAKKYDITKYEEKLSNIKKQKNALINEKKNINNEFSKKRKRYQSILLTSDKAFNDFTKKFNKMANNENKTQKNKITNPKSRRMSVYEILHKRGFNSNFLENLNTDSNVHQNKKMKLNLKNGLYNHSNDKLNKLEQIDEKEEDKIKKTHFGVKYIVFENKNELKTKYQKEKWNLSISNITSIFLKAIRPNKIQNKLNNDNNQDNNNVKNNSELEKLYKNNFDNNNIKIEKISLNYTANEKKDFKNNDLSNSSNESKSSSRNSSKKVLNNEPIHKNKESEKDINNGNNQVKLRDKLNLNLASIFHNSKEGKKSDEEILKSVNSGSNIREVYNKNDGINYLSDPNQNNSRKNLTHQERKNKNNKDYIIEEKEKKIGKVKSKKAKIKKFKSSKEESAPDDDERRRKGNLYDYYSSKIPKNKKHCLKDENDKENSSNSKNKNNNNNSRYEYNNYSHKKPTSLRKCKSGQDIDEIYINQSTTKKQKGQINPINFLGKKNDNPSLIISYRQKIMEGISNRNNNTNNKENSKNINNKSMSALRRKNENKLKLNSSLEMQKIDAIKSKMKKKLIEINNKLIDALFYYNGPIDISCISLKNYSQTVDDLAKRALKNGYKCSKLETNHYKLTNGVDTFFVEIVKIRNNMLYYLIAKNQ